MNYITRLARELKQELARLEERERAIRAAIAALEASR
jgi:prefoldin subunit 5